MSFPSSDWFESISVPSLKDLRDMKSHAIQKIAQLEVKGVYWGRRIGLDEFEDDALFRFLMEKA